MRYALGHGYDRLRLRFAGSELTDPADLFGPSDQGAVYDFTDMASLFQTFDTSTPVTAMGQAIGRASDLSGKNNHATQPTAGMRPIYQGYGAFDGIDDLLATDAVDMSLSDKATVVASARVNGVTQQAIMSLGSAGNGRFNVEFLAGASPEIQGQLIGSTGTSAIKVAGDVANSVDVVVAVLFDLAGAIAADEITVRKNGAVPSQVVNAAGPAGGGNLAAAQNLRVGAISSIDRLDGRIYRLIIINRELIAAELSGAEAWCGA